MGLDERLFALAYSRVAHSAVDRHMGRLRRQGEVARVVCLDGVVDDCVVRCQSVGVYPNAVEAQWDATFFVREGDAHDRSYDFAEFALAKIVVSFLNVSPGDCRVDVALLGV